VHEWLLEVFHGEACELVPVTDGAPVVLGSSARATLRVDDRTVSSQHCEIRVAGNRLQVVDLGSLNGTFVGPARVREAWAGVGTVVTMGETQVIVHSRDVDEEPCSLEAGDALPMVAGRSMVMRRLATRVRRLADLNSPVLVTGETGTGKELVARALHLEGRRAAGPFFPLNVANLPRELVESELFGHDRGAFTGAVKQRAGAFVEARGGTLFLDEIGELPLDAQPKLLRALDGYEVRRVGSYGGGARSDVRVVAATHKPLHEDVAEGRFRRDLFHRLEAFVVVLPPLRERRGDIACIARRLLANLDGELGPRTLTSAAIAQLSSFDWLGNVRELRNALLRAAEGSAHPEIIDDVDISRAMRRSTPPPTSAQITRAYAELLMRKHNNNMAAAARDAEMPRTSFRKLLKK
jgi:DNA-binding NtrC family response regulator